MILRRSASGLASLHLFFSVDVVVYCEGGTPVVEAGIAEGAGEDDTLDALFWRRISQFVGATRRYHFKSVGNKSTLETIARDVGERQISTIIVCLDRDYDWHCACKMELDHVVYTHGYSWESDVVCFVGMERIFFRLVSRRPESEQLFRDGTATFKIFAAHLAKWCEAEIALRQKGKGALFPRTSPLAMVDLAAEPPKLSEARLRTQLRSLGYKRRPRVIIRISEADSLRHAWGKLVSRYFYHLVMRLVNRQDEAIRLSYDVFMRFLMADMIEAMGQGALVELATYYRGMATIFR
jgi:hypothetical protein